MAVDPRTLGWLARALNHEMGAVQQYLAQSVLARLWGDVELAAHLRAEAMEELEHAELLIERQILLGVAPCGGQLPVVRLGRNAQELFAHDQQMEVQAVQLYVNALMHAQRLRDQDSIALFQSLLAQEQEHLEHIAHTKSG
ncbi:ferritin-like domain-containing protein [Nitrosomonas eutropha]|uniref:Bacterioferritin n=2 Tax=Nitrosomonas eutropha TaxID=916 RepID=A0ABX5MAC4_9PROT|nr:ferritin-like domain-containing protein [Nitrosomonas eutropha]ABI59079.1 Ferritin, Dps family protein [Nitrosomonas eutropha C91]PXV83960.1 bacterioferritin [Nitrosomonas eutropha]SEI45792.1 bacterioferritin [Nitrosomonas eutropha]